AYWLIHATGNFTNPASWASDEKRLTDTSFNMTIAPSSRGNFLGDYQGLSAGGADGNSFYALFGQAGTDATNNSNIWFRDPPPAPESAVALAAPATVSPFSAPTLVNALADLGFGVVAGNTPAPDSADPATVRDR